MSSDKTNEDTESIEKAKKLIKEVRKYQGIQRAGDVASDQEVIIGLTYLSSQNLVKHSNSLNCWTIVIGISTVLLFISAVLQLVKLFLIP